MFDVFFYEAFEEETAAIKRHLPKNLSAGFTWKTLQEQGDNEPPARIISLRTQSAIPESWAHSLSAVLARSTGYDHLLERRGFKDAGVALGYLPLYSNRAVAEQAMMMWMALGRRLPRQQRRFGTFHRDGLTGIEFERKNLLVVGVGNIGYEVCRLGWGLGMTVRGVDIVHRRDDLDYTSIAEGLPSADVIVCAMNLTSENIGYFNYDRLRSAKKGAIFVNIARGEESPSADLLRLLEEGCLGGVGLDVYNRERELAVALREGQRPDNAECRATLALADREDAILTPHNAFNTRESVERKAAQSVEQIAHFLTHNTFKWNVPA